MTVSPYTPASQLDLCYASVAQLRSGFQARTVSPVEYAGAVFDRIGAVNPEVNAMVDLYEDEARAAARKAEQSYFSGTARDPLAGILVAIKDETQIAGKRTTQGSVRLRDHVDTRSSAVVERIVDAGGIIHGRTAAPEYCVAPFTHSDLWGITRNPWNLGMTPGGSSGGSGAALAAGMTTLADGSDVGGSIRIPATFCGLVGYRPPRGRVAGDWPYNLDPHEARGPLARTVDDCAVLQNVLAGQHPSDPISLPSPPQVLADDAPRSLAGLRIAISEDCGGFPTSQEVRDAMRATGERLRAHGARVTFIEAGWTFDEVQRASAIHSGTYIGPSLTQEHEVPLTRYAAKVAERAQNIAKSDFREMITLEGKIHRALAEVFADHDIFLTPTVSTPHLIAGEDYVDAGPEVDGVPTTKHRDVTPTLLFSICSTNPVLSLPIGFGSAGVPLGMQVAAKPFDDHAVFDFARAFEVAEPWPLGRGRQALANTSFQLSS